jgi:tetratricopeptide (TPR) repeat protein
MLTASRKLLITLPVTLLFSVTCWAQTTAFDGDVKGEDGKGVQGAMVHIDRKDIKGTYKVKTDKKGHYYYGGLPIGTYRISVEVDGKERDSIDNVRSKLGDPTSVPFDLKEAAARAAAASGTAGAAGAPKEVEKGMSAADKAAYEKKLKEQSEKMAKNKELNDAFNAGVEAQNNKQWDVAIQSFEKAITLDPTQNVIFGRLADAYVNLAQTKTGAEQDAALEKSVGAYQKAIELKADAPEYHNNYALALAKQKKFAEAQAELTKAAQLDPTQAGKYYYNMGAVLVNTGQMEPAGDAFKKALEIDPNYADAHYQYGIYLIGKATTTADGKITPPPGTGEEFQKYLQLRPDGPFADSAKAMLATIGQTVETQFSKPGEKKQTPKKKSQ